MTGRPRCAPFAALVISFAGVALSGHQSPQQSAPLFRSGVDLVEVDVAVTDETGRPVRGLSKDDFTVHGHSIASFQEVSREFGSDPVERAMRQLPRDVADNRSAKDATLVALVLDDRIFRDQLAKSKKIARQVVEQLGPGSEIGLLLASGRQAVEVTDDRVRLLEAIDRLQISRAVRLVRDVSVVTAPCSFELFEQAARQLAPQPAQRKAIVAITPFCGADVTGAVNSMAPRAQSETEQAAVRMVDAMRRANVAFFAIDPRGAVGFSYTHFPDSGDVMGLRGDMDSGSVAGPAPRGGSPNHLMPSMLLHEDPVILSQDNLHSVANATGGIAITNTDDIDGGIARVVSDFDHYYLLGFAPTDTHSTSFEKINVTVNRPGAVIRARRGYQLGGERKQAVTLQSVSISGFVPAPDVPLRLFAMPFAPTTGGVREIVTLEVQAPRDGLRAPDGSLEDDVTVTIAAVRSDQARVEKAFAFDRHLVLPKDSTGASGQPTVTYQIVRAMDLPPGPYQLRVSVKSSKLNMTGSVYLSTDVPDYSQQALEISGPLLGYADASHQPKMLTQVEPNTLSFQPVLDRVFKTDDILRVVCPVWRADAAGTVTAAIALVNAQGHDVITSSAPLSSGTAAGVDARLSLAGIAPGPYLLRVTATNGTATTAREVGIAIR